MISGNTTSGITLDNASGVVILGNLIGTNAAGTARLPNLQDGISVIDGANNDTIGGTTAGAGNLISGNGWDGILVCGVEHSGTGNVTIQGNKIGTNLAGTAALDNASDGVQVNWGASGVVIGGTATGAGNLISGNAGDGVHIFRSTGNTVQGNKIGTDVTGKVAIENHFDGVYLGSGDNTIGGSTTGAGNVIAGNGTYGIWVNGDTNITLNNVDFETCGNTNGVVIQGNSVGVNSAGTGLANGSDAIYLLTPGTITIGGSTVADGNTISGGGTSAGAGCSYMTQPSGTGSTTQDHSDCAIVTAGTHTGVTITNDTLLSETQPKT